MSSLYRQSEIRFVCKNVKQFVNFPPADVEGNVLLLRAILLWVTERVIRYFKFQVELCIQFALKNSKDSIATILVDPGEFRQ